MRKKRNRGGDTCKMRDKILKRGEERYKRKTKLEKIHEGKR